jgi:hypothetical protein
VVHSADAGVTFDAPVDTRDPAGPKLAKLARFVVSGAPGAPARLDLTYYGGDTDPDPKGSFRWTVSHDAGKTFGPSTAIGPARFTGRREWPLWMGDYSGLGVTADGLSLASAYVDGSSGSAHVLVAVDPL